MNRKAFLVLGTPAEAYRFNVPFYKIKDGERLYSALKELEGAYLKIEGLGKFWVRRIIDEPFPKAGVVILSLYCEEIIDVERLV